MHYNTVSESLHKVLKILMQAEVFSDFRLVGGTSLSLQLGHRVSVDIDLFSDLQYGTIDFEAIDSFIEKTFPFHSHFSTLETAIGKSYNIGNSKNDFIKVDIYYTDQFIRPNLVVNDLRLATLDEIVAMKIDIIQRGGRKKDFWDLHRLLDDYSISQMLDLHEERYKYNHDKEMILSNFIMFEMADEDFDPECLLGKHWEFIKEDIIEEIEKFINNQ